MLEVIQNALSKSYSYDQYRKQISALLSEGKSSGNEQSEDLLHYSELNETRMNRLDKTIKVPVEIGQQMEGLSRPYTWLVISEGWCGDAAQILPVIHKMAEQSEKIDMKIVFRDENEELMGHFLTNGTKSIPKLIVLDSHSLRVLGDFGPRPEGARTLIQDYKKHHGVVDELAKTNLQLWYLHDKGLSTQKEIAELMIRLDLAAVQMPQAR